MYGGNGCSFCDRAKQLLQDSGIKYKWVNIDLKPGGRKEQLDILREGGVISKDWKTVPVVLDRHKVFIGGFSALKDVVDQSSKMLIKMDDEDDF